MLPPASASVSVSVSYTLSLLPHPSLSQSVSVSCSVVLTWLPCVALSVSLSVPLGFGAPTWSVAISVRVSDTLSVALYLLPEPVLAIVLRVVRVPLLQWQICPATRKPCYITARR